MLTCGQDCKQIHRCYVILLTMVLSGLISDIWAQQEAQLELTIIDMANGNKIPARILVRDNTDKNYIPDNTVIVPIGNDKWFASLGSVKLNLQPATYIIRAERGPEYHPVIKEVTVAPEKPTRQIIKMQRWIDIKLFHAIRRHE